MDINFDPMKELLNAIPEIGTAIQEWDALLHDRRALVRNIEESQKLLDEQDERIKQFQVNFKDRLQLKPAGKPAAKAKPAKKAPEKSLGSEIVGALDDLHKSMAAPKKQAFGPWLGNVKQSLKKIAPLSAEATATAKADWLKSQYEQGIKPGEAVKVLMAAKVEPFKPADPPIPPAAPEVILPSWKLSEPNPDGKSLFLSKTGLTEADLDMALSPEVRPDAFERSRIGVPLTLKGKQYACVQLNARATHNVYHLQPIESAAMKRRVEWTDRRKQFPDLDPADIPLVGVVAVDDKGFDYIFGPDTERLYVEVPVKKPAAVPQ